ncbi:hypothetical protein B5807_11234 [Epicoccum nigrum]|uniref:Glycosyltransferase 2-like domain-containing protein n=1 Tax=Epicoccum nigrum TaxID=105696 RepID=A0A1Y2LJH7_EPING|nr:hypothetical protein B5807_11234 [Epicoccum nigrum]
MSNTTTNSHSFHSPTCQEILNLSVDRQSALFEVYYRYIMSLSCREFGRYMLLAMAASSQVSQIIQDGIFLFCVAREGSKHRTASRFLMSFAISLAHLIFRCTCLFATSIFLYEVGFPNALVSPLLILNLVLYFPHRLLSWTCALQRLHQQRPGSISVIPPRGSDESEALLPPFLPTIVAIIPCHGEPEDVLLASVRSLMNSDYPSDQLHIVVAFDGLENSQLHNRVSSILSAEAKPGGRHPISRTATGIDVTLCLFEHGGKPRCQRNALEYIRNARPHLLQSPDEVAVLMMDSDTTIPTESLRLFADRMYSVESSQTSPAALACVQGIDLPSSSFLHAIQEAEYLQQGVMCELVMASLSNVTCISGTVMYVRWEALVSALNDQPNQLQGLNDCWKYKFGEDRYLTQVISSKVGSWSTDIHTDIVCNTQAACSLPALIDQRRRWFLGHMAVEAVALSDPAHWKMSPKLFAYRLVYLGAQVSEQQIVLLATLVIVQGWAAQYWLPWLVTAALVLNGASFCCFPAIRRRRSLAPLPIFGMVSPVLNLVVRLYALLNLWSTKWGGTRDLAQAQKLKSS